MGAWHGPGIGARHAGFGLETVADLVPVIFGRKTDHPHRLVFAFSGSLAHVNATIRSERLRIAVTAQGLALEAA